MKFRFLQAVFLVELTRCSAERDMDMGSEPGARVKDKERHFKIYKDSARMNLNRTGPPQTLEVYLSIVDEAQAFHLTFPPGYEVASEDRCGIFKTEPREEYNKYGDRLKDLSAAVTSCETFSSTSSSSDFSGSEMPGGSTGSDASDSQMSGRSADSDASGRQLQDGTSQPSLHGGSESLPRVTLKISINNDTKLVAALQEDPLWWFFGVHIWNPDVDPRVKDNFFQLAQFHENVQKQEGSLVVAGFVVLGDWPCKYSDWQNWGGCSARCGGGVMRQIRKVLIEPPPDGALADKPCTEVEETLREVPCNTFDCEMKCELVDRNEKKAALCSSECGGGLKATRWRWRGDNCPSEDDVSSAEISSCNTQPCKVKCVLADTWTVVTECSELCGMGTYRMMRMVLQKDPTDEACQPEWKEVPCVRQLCTPLTVLRPDRHIWPLVDDWYRVGLAFRLDQDTVKITLLAPLGFVFGMPGSSCTLYDHDMIPAFKSCTVGEKNLAGEYKQSHLIVLNFNGELQKNQYGRYHFLVSVKNPPCPNNKYKQTSQNGERCDIAPDQNIWGMMFEEEGKTQFKTLWAAGYDLFKSEEDMQPQGAPDMADLFLGQGATNEAQSISLDNNGMWRARAIFCSARFNECPDGSACPEDGVCPPTQDESGLPTLNGDVDGNLDLKNQDFHNQSEDHNGKDLDQATSERGDGKE
mmetsp:Transcript_88881/g.162989  ORF Transcript_88881/g.162989 Transcript_88881/m.162989 type:complete len:695 (-) Transcript_88881:94-2178(-)